MCLTSDDLGCMVVASPDERRRSLRLLGARSDELGVPKVHKLEHAICGEENISRFEVPIQERESVIEVVQSENHRSRDDAGCGCVDTRGAQSLCLIPDRGVPRCHGSR
eukprot:scaffold222247_cov39-Tisochrysis_lutea.AAC.2